LLTGYDVTSTRLADQIDAQSSPPDAAGAARTSIWGDLVEVMQDVVGARDLVYQLTLRDIRIKYKQAVMGFAWAVLMPVLVVMAGILIRFIMARASGEAVGGPVIGGMAVKALCWSFFVGAIGLATTSLITNMALLTKIYFPREVLPLSTTLAQTVDTLIGAVAVACLLPFVGAQWTLQLIWVPVLFILLFGFTLAVAVFLSCANLFFRDVKYIVQVLLTFGIFATPVLFEPQMLGRTGGRLLMLNPLSPIMEGLRLTIMQGRNLFAPVVVTLRDGAPFVAWSPWYLGYVALWTTIGLVVSVVVFRRAAFAFAEYI